MQSRPSAPHKALPQLHFGQATGRLPPTSARWVHSNEHTRVHSRERRGAAPNGADVAFAKAFAIGDFGKCRNATNPDIFNQSPRLGDGGKQRSGSIVGFVVGSCTMPFTAMKVGTAQGSVTAGVARSPG